MAENPTKCAASHGKHAANRANVGWDQMSGKVRARRTLTVWRRLFLCSESAEARARGSVSRQWLSESDDSERSREDLL